MSGPWRRDRMERWAGEGGIDTADVRIPSVSVALGTHRVAEAAAHWAGDDGSIAPGWLLAWYAAFAAPEAAPCVLWEPGGEIAGLLPLTLRRRGPMRVLQSPTNGHSQRTAFLCSPGREADFAAAALAGLERMTGWDVLHLQGLAPQAADGLVAAGRAAGWSAEVERSFLHLIHDPHQPSPERSGKTQRRQARQERGLQRLGDVRGDWSVGSAAGPALEAFLLGEHRSWKASGGELLMATPAITAFYRALAAGSGGSDGLEVGFLHVDDRVAAGLLLLRRGGRRIALKVFHDAAFDRLSPAWMLLRHAMVRAENGVFDFYSGRDAYAPLANSGMEFRDILLWPPRLRTRMLRGLRAARRGLPAGG